MPSCDEFVPYCQNFDFKIRRIIKKISYERRGYESVDEKVWYIIALPETYITETVEYTSHNTQFRKQVF